MIPEQLVVPMVDSWVDGLVEAQTVSKRHNNDAAQLDHRWSPECTNSCPKSTNLGTELYEMGSQNPPKLVPGGLLEGSWKVSWRCLEAMLGHLGATGAPRWTRSENNLQTLVRWTPYGYQVGGQNPAKIYQKSLKMKRTSFKKLLCNQCPMMD